MNTNTKRNRLLETIKKSRLLCFLKKHKKPLLITASILLALILIYQGICMVYNAVLTKNIQAWLDGKTFLYNIGSWTDAYSFEGNTMSAESWIPLEPDQDNFVSRGDITVKKPYKIKGELGTCKIDIWIKNDHWEYEVGNIEYFKDWSLDLEWTSVTMEEVLTKRTYDACSHEFQKAEIIKKASCTQEGEQQKTCRKCQYTLTESINKEEHNYQNNTCTKCRQKKPTERETGFSPDTWYVYDGILNFQNCRIVSATIIKNGGLVVYDPVCRSCRAVGMRDMSYPELNYPILKSLYCKECGATTYIRLEID